MPKYLKVTNLTHAIRQIWPCTSGKQASEKNGRICFLLFLGAWRFKRGNWVWTDVELPLDLFSLLSARSWLLKLTLINLNSCYLILRPFHFGPTWSSHVQPQSLFPQFSRSPAEAAASQAGSTVLHRCKPMAPRWTCVGRRCGGAVVITWGRRGTPTTRDRTWIAAPSCDGLWSWRSWRVMWCISIVRWGMMGV